MTYKNFELSKYLGEKRDIVDKYLNKILDQCNSKLELTKAMRHSLMAGGKRLRPVLCMASAEAVGKDPMLSLPGACAIEMIHTYSLIHDDLPAMDDDDLRRGVKTCHKAFNEATAILAGDALLTHAFSVLAKPWDVFEECPDKNILFELINIISNAAGPNGMVKGQMMDMAASSEEAAPLSLEGLKKLHTLKTGKMIIVSVKVGALSVNADPVMLENLSVYSEKIGLAFQVTDDILNVEGDPAIMGKAVGSDAFNDKMTFPALMGLDESKKFAQRLVDDAIDSLKIFDKKALPLKTIADYIIKRKR